MVGPDEVERAAAEKAPYLILGQRHLLYGGATHHKLEEPMTELATKLDTIR